MGAKTGGSQIQNLLLCNDALLKWFRLTPYFQLTMELLTSAESVQVQMFLLCPTEV